jgi:hypothetical protein
VRNVSKRPWYVVFDGDRPVAAYARRFAAEHATFLSNRTVRACTCDEVVNMFYRGPVVVANT